jgi:hypothetical protein
MDTNEKYINAFFLVVSLGLTAAGGHALRNDFYEYTGTRSLAIFWTATGVVGSVWHSIRPYLE